MIGIKVGPLPANRFGLRSPMFGGKGRISLYSQLSASAATTLGSVHDAGSFGASCGSGTISSHLAFALLALLALAVGALAPSFSAAGIRSFEHAAMPSKTIATASAGFVIHRQHSRRARPRAVASGLGAHARRRREFV